MLVLFLSHPPSALSPSRRLDSPGKYENCLLDPSSHHPAVKERYFPLQCWLRTTVALHLRHAVVVFCSGDFPWLTSGAKNVRCLFVVSVGSTSGDMPADTEIDGGGYRAAGRGGEP